MVEVRWLGVKGVLGGGRGLLAGGLHPDGDGSRLLPRAVVEYDVVVPRFWDCDGKGEAPLDTALEERALDSGIVPVLLLIYKGDSHLAISPHPHSDHCILRQVSDPEGLPSARVHLHRENNRASYLGGSGDNDAEERDGEQPEPARHDGGLVPRARHHVNSPDPDPELSTANPAQGGSIPPLGPTVGWRPAIPRASKRGPRAVRRDWQKVKKVATSPSHASLSHVP